MSLLVALINQQRWLLLVATLGSVLHGLLVSCLIATLNSAIDAPSQALGSLGTEFLGLSACALLCRWFSLTQFVRAGENTLATLRMRLSRWIADVPLEDLERRGAGRIFAVLTQDIATVGECFLVLPSLLIHSVVLMACVAYLGWLSPPAFAVAAVIVLVASAGYARKVLAAQVHLRRARHESDALFAHFEGLFAGATELKLNQRRREAFINTVLRVSAERVRDARTQGMVRHAALGSWRVFLLFAVLGLTLFVLGPRFELSANVLSGYALTLLYMLLPLNAALETVPSLGTLKIALEKVAEYTTRDVIDAASPLSTRVASGGARGSAAPGSTAASPVPSFGRFQSLRLRSIVHRYRSDSDDAEFQIGPIELELKPAEVVFLIGGNGSGKTTLAKLLVGLYEPLSGDVLLNGQRIDSELRPAYREQFSAVFSDFHVFDSPATEQQSRSDADVEELLHAFKLSHKVRVDRGVLSTTALSSGQRKRLALVAAWLQDRPIYLFDEWAADQDPEFKEIFYGTILPRLKARNKAVCVISHDDRYFDAADRCLRLVDGQLIDVGPEPTSGVARSALSVGFALEGA